MAFRDYSAAAKLLCRLAAAGTDAAAAETAFRLAVKKLDQLSPATCPNARHC